MAFDTPGHRLRPPQVRSCETSSDSDCTLNGWCACVGSAQITENENVIGYPPCLREANRRKGTGWLLDAARRHVTMIPVVTYDSMDARCSGASI